MYIQALLNELIAEEAQRHEYEVAYELEDKITDLRNMLQEKEHATKELERVKMIPETEDIYIKVREVIQICIYIYILTSIDYWTLRIKCKIRKRIKLSKLNYR